MKILRAKATWHYGFLSLPIILYLGTIAGVAAHKYTTVLHEMIESSRASGDDVEDELEIFDWIKKNTKQSDILLCFPDPRYYLFTGRQAMAPFFRMPAEVKREDERRFILRQNNIRYVIVGMNDLRVEPHITQLLIYYSNGLNPVFRSSRDHVWVYEAPPN